jgi:hypothetical protein
LKAADDDDDDDEDDEDDIFGAGDGWYIGICVKINMDIY